MRAYACACACAGTPNKSSQASTYRPTLPNTYDRYLGTSGMISKVITRVSILILTISKTKKEHPTKRTTWLQLTNLTIFALLCFGLGLYRLSFDQSVPLCLLFCRRFYMISSLSIYLSTCLSIYLCLNPRLSSFFLLLLLLLLLLLSIYQTN